MTDRQRIAALRNFIAGIQCKGCGGSGKYMNRRIVSGSFATADAVYENKEVICKLCDGSGRDAAATKILRADELESL
jgi:hypothetical protein